MKYLLLIVSVLFADQALKQWISHHLAVGETLFYNPVIDLTYLKNTGAAWSMFSGQKWVLIIIAIVAIGVLSCLILKHYHQSLLATGLSLALGGAIGNLIDRVMYGYVIDMFQLEFISFPIFNIADIALCIGVLLIFIYIMKED